MDLFHSRCAFLNTRNNVIKNFENIVYLSTSLLRQIFDFVIQYFVQHFFLFLQSIFDFVVQYFVQHFFLFLQSPYCLSICATYRSLFLSVILMHCISIEEPHVLSYLAALYVSRNMFLKHDFLARIAFFFTNPCIPLPSLFLVIKLLLFFQYTFQVTSVQTSMLFLLL